MPQGRGRDGSGYAPLKARPVPRWLRRHCRPRAAAGRPTGRPWSG